MLCGDGEEMETLLRERTAARGFKTGDYMNLMEFHFICQVYHNMERGFLPGGKKLVYMNGICTDVRNYLTCMKCPVNVHAQICGKTTYPNTLVHLERLIRKLDPEWTRDTPS